MENAPSPAHHSARGAGRGRADYNEWGEITYREALTITSSYRRIYPQSNYTGHDWDDVLGMYYAKARFYSAEDKRFVAMDPVKRLRHNHPLAILLKRSPATT